MKFLKLIRYENLLLLAFTQFIFRYAFLEQQEGLPLALNDWQYALFVLACVFIAAGGFLINAMLDRNKPFDQAEGISYNIYAALNIAGVGIGFYIANLVGSPGFSAVFIVVAATLYLYASSLKYSLLIGNLIVAVITALCVLMIGVFDLYPVITTENQPYLSTIFQLLMDYAVFIFLITFLREVVKDLRDIDTDYNAGANSLPIAIGKVRTAKAVFFAALVPVAILIYYGNTYIINLLWTLVYGLLFILGPMIYFLIKIWNARTPKDFNHLSHVLWAVLLFTSLSIAVITFNIRYNA